MRLVKHVQHRGYWTRLWPTSLQQFLSHWRKFVIVYTEIQLFPIHFCFTNFSFASCVQFYHISKEREDRIYNPSSPRQEYEADTQRDTWYQQGHVPVSSRPKTTDTGTQEQGNSKEFLLRIWCKGLWVKMAAGRQGTSTALLWLYSPEISNTVTRSEHSNHYLR